jgi:hypothetical protein
MLGVGLLLHEKSTKRTARHIDVPGLALYASAITLLLLSLTAAADDHSLWQGPFVWLGIRGHSSFEGRASFKAWMFRILANRARTRAVRNARSIPVSSLVQAEVDSDEPAVDPSRFRSAADPYPGHWLLKPSADAMPEERHRMDCSRCGLSIGGEQAKLVHDDASLLRVTAEVPMTEVQRLLNAGQREAAARALAAAKEVPPPIPPSVAFLTNPAGLSDDRLQELAELAIEDAHAQLTLVADDLIATLGEQRGKDGRNVAVTALRKRLAFVRGLIQRCHVPLDPPDATTLGPGSGTHPI